MSRAGVVPVAQVDASLQLVAERLMNGDVADALRVLEALAEGTAVMSFAPGDGGVTPRLVDIFGVWHDARCDRDRCYPDCPARRRGRR